LTGKVALVTGGSRGIGAAIAAKLARDGAKVVVNYLANAEAARHVVDKIVLNGGDAFAVEADVSRIDAAEPLIAAVLHRYGRLDILVNNAAVAFGGPVDSLVEADFDRLFATNVKSVLFLSQAAARVLDMRGGSIINIGSLAAKARPPQFAIYAATKAAVEALTGALAREWGALGVRVNTVAPGDTDTEMQRAAFSPERRRAAIERVALGRVGQPEDIAEVVAFLASDEARWITGETLQVNGGQRP
jgi:3-oxoacyl-[acyl-carrier protein] reductase